MIPYKNSVIQQDLHFLAGQSVDWTCLKDSSVLVTGATGMLASFFSFMLMYLNEQYNYGIRITLLARNKKNLEQIFGKESENVRFVIQDVCEPIEIEEEVTYILHAAGAASPYHIVNNPVDIIKANTVGTINVMELAKKAKTEKILYTSTREVYGKVDGKDSISESDMGIIDPLDARSCYPESKRMAENILKSYAIQDQITFNTLRIAHTYGPGMKLADDGRVMADFLNDAVNNRDIQMNSAGTAVRAFCYLSDAVEAMFKVLISGAVNEAYNIANESEPVQIADLATKIQSISENGKRVITIDGQTSKQGYCSYKRVELDTGKIRMLGWKPSISLTKGLSKTIQYLKG